MQQSLFCSLKEGEPGAKGDHSQGSAFTDRWPCPIPSDYSEQSWMLLHILLLPHAVTTVPDHASDEQDPQLK